MTKITVKVADPNGRTIHQFIITKPRIVRRVVGLYNSLGVIQPVAMSCPLELGGLLTVKFYASAMKLTATASSPTDGNASWTPDVAAWACFPIKLTLAQHSYPSLSGNVITPLGKLLHTRLAPRTT